MTKINTKLNGAKHTKKSMLSKAWLATLAILTITLGIYHSNESSKVANQLAIEYEISLDMAYGLQCYKGSLHYPNHGSFSGLLPVLPKIQCDMEKFEIKSHNKYKIWFGISLLSTIMSILIIWGFKSD